MRPPQSTNPAGRQSVAPKTSIHRREFLKQAPVAAAAVAALASQAGCGTLGKSSRPLFEISIAEWSLHKALFGRAGARINHLDFPTLAKNQYGIHAIELVNQFFKDKAKDQAYLKDFNQRADGEGVRILLIMCDGEGNLGDPDSAKRRTAVQNHHQWADAAKYFGCHSIRVNAETGAMGSFEEQQKRAADGLRELSEYCAKLRLNCIVENHGRLSSNGAWLAGVMRMVNLPNCGTLPDFGNFNLGDGKQYDRYQGVTELMPFAKAVSAKTNDFDAAGNEIHTDYRRMMKIVLDAGYRGFVGVEYEGERASEPDGIRLSKRLLERVRDELSASYARG